MTRRLMMNIDHWGTECIQILPSEETQTLGKLHLEIRFNIYTGL